MELYNIHKLNFVSSKNINLKKPFETITIIVTQYSNPTYIFLRQQKYSFSFKKLFFLCNKLVIQLSWT